MVSSELPGTDAELIKPAQKKHTLLLWLKADPLG
jgi:hypothetical protein